MTRVRRRLAEAIWRFRALLAMALVGLTVACGWAVATLQVSHSLETWYPEGDSLLQDYRRFRERYGNDEVVVLAVETPGPERFASDAGLEQIGILTDRLLALDGVASVTSLVTVPTSLEEVRKRMLSRDGRTTVLVVQPSNGDLADDLRASLLAAIRAAAVELGYSAHLGGYGVVFEALNDASTTGAVALVAAAHVVMLLLLSLFFRRAFPVVVTIVAVSSATIITMGLYAASGHSLNMVTMVLPTLVLVIGTADCVHLLRSIGATGGATDVGERVVAGIEKVIGPCFLTTATTAAGFIGLMVSGLPVVQELGRFGAVGVAAGFLAAFIAVPVGCSLLACAPATAGAWPDRIMPGINRLATDSRKLVATAFALLACAAVAGMVRIKSDTDSLAYLPENHRVRADAEFIETRIGPFVPVEFVVTADTDVLADGYRTAISDWQARVEAFPEIGWGWSLLNLVGAGGADREAVERRLTRMVRISPGAIESLRAGDRELRISFGATALSARRLENLLDRIRGAAHFPAGLSLAAAGYSPVYTRIVDEAVDSQVDGLATALVLIMALLGLAMRCWRRLLLAVPANAVPLLAMLGAMGLFDIPLDVASSTIATVVLGLVVDDSVHLLRLVPGRSLSDAIRYNSDSAGGSLVMTSVILAGGLLVLGFSEIRSIAWFGLLSGFAVSVAIVTDLLLLPALAGFLDRRPDDPDPIPAMT